MRRLAAVVSLAAAFLAAGAVFASPRPTYGDSVVGVVVTRQDWNEDRPWAKRPPATRSGEGVVVEGPYILTKARMVERATLIRMEKFGRTTEFQGRPIVVDPEIDLALLAVDDPAFFEGLRPARLVGRTPASGVVRTVRWHGRQLEVVTSRIKRFDVQESYFGRLRNVFLLVQTDMSGGGWSEPVFDGDRLAGITVSQNEQRARVIPAEILSAFLERARSAETYRGFPVLETKWQSNEDPALAAYLGQADGARGALIRQVPWGSSGCGVLQPRDVVLALDGHAVDADGVYDDPEFGRIEFTNIAVDGHRPGDVLPVRVLRDRRVLDLKITLREYPTSLELIPVRRGDRPPPYVVAGGLVFRELDQDYLRSWGDNWSTDAPLSLLVLASLREEAQRPERRRIVLLASVLPSQYNIGYQELHDLPVRSINGRPIDSIPDVVEALRHPVDGFHTVVLEPNSQRGEIVLDAAALDAATAEVMKAYQVPVAVRLPESPPPDGGPDCPGGF